MQFASFFQQDRLIGCVLDESMAKNITIFQIGLSDDESCFFQFLNIRLKVRFGIDDRIQHALLEGTPDYRCGLKYIFGLFGQAVNACA